MSDLTDVIQPKVDQITADDLISGPRTIRITSVSVSQGAEQPVVVHFEGEDGRPWKPCKSMTRVLVHLWGADSTTFAGRSVTLFRDPAVKWGGLEVGGIRISHMSDINGRQVMALTATRGNKKPFTVMPLAVQPTQAKRQTTREWGDGMLARIAACTTEDDLHAIHRDPAVTKMRQALVAGPPSAQALDKQIADAIGEKYAALTASSPAADEPAAAD